MSDLSTPHLTNQNNKYILDRSNLNNSIEFTKFPVKNKIDVKQKIYHNKLNQINRSVSQTTSVKAEGRFIKLSYLRRQQISGTEHFKPLVGQHLKTKDKHISLSIENHIDKTIQQNNKHHDCNSNSELNQDNTALKDQNRQLKINQQTLNQSIHRQQQVSIHKHSSTDYQLKSDSELNFAQALQN